MKIIIGKKLHMTHHFGDAGGTPVTVIAAGPCTVTQVKGKKDGYQAIQLGFDATHKKIAKPQAGHLKGLAAFRHMHEFKTDTAADRGDVCTVAQFKTGDLVKVTGVSKGKGFQGVVKRHHFHGSPKTHGHKDQLRMPGSIGAGGVQHVFKGTRMGGRMGNEQVTVANLEVIAVDAEKNLLYVKGAVPGARNQVVTIMADGDVVFEKPMLKKEEPVTETVPVADVITEADAATTEAPGAPAAEETPVIEADPVATPKE
jgi:large subunit ribosomal protein L3